MKKRLCIFIVMVIVMSTVLTSCNFAEDIIHNAKRSLYEKTIWDSSLGDQPYSFEFVSRYDGTCYIKNILINPSVDQPFVMEIPEKSPEGDTVEEISIRAAAQGWGAATIEFPVMVRADTFDTLCAEMEANGMSESECLELKGCYLKLSPEGLSERGKAELLDAYPVVSVGDVYLVNFEISAEAAQRVNWFFKTYLNWDDERTDQCYNELVLMANECNAMGFIRDFFLSIRDKKWEYVSEVIIPDSVESISGTAFTYCSGLKSVKLSEGLRSIGDRAFESCTGLKSVKLSEGLRSIGDRAFESCTGLTEIVFPDSVRYVGDDAFAYCVGLKSVSHSGSTIRFGERSFAYCESLTSVQLSEGEISFEKDVFAHCTGLESIRIPNGTTCIPDSAFEGCTSLKSVEIPDSIEQIEGSAFAKCTSLEHIVLPNGITKIDDFTFFGCTNLSGIVIPRGVVSIGLKAFDGCTKLTVYYSGAVIEWNAISKEKSCLGDVNVQYNYVPE